MSMEVSSDRAICSRCSTAYSRHKGYFPVSYAALHKGAGYIPVCKDCIDSMYNVYLSKCSEFDDPVKYAVRQMCRKLDLYWSESVYNTVEKKNTPRSMMTQYIAKINSVTYAGKSYDDTLIEEGALWNLWGNATNAIEQKTYSNQEEQNESIEDIPDDVIQFWGSGYSPSMYGELEQRRAYYMSKLPKCEDIDIGSEALIRQICNLEVTIAKDSAAGRAIDKSVNSLNSLLGSLNIKPTQRKNEDMDTEMSNTPLGVWLYRYENKRPLPDLDEQLKDVNHLKKYIFTWMGHLCKMLNIKNGYTRMYEEEVNKLRVDKPEFDGDEEDLLTETYSEE